MELQRFEGADGYALVLETLARVIDEPPLPTISEWAAKSRMLSAKSSAEPGPWRNERIPFLAAVMDALLPSHPAPIVTFVKSSQVGGSECALNWVGRTVDVQPGSFLALGPSDAVQRKWVRTRLDSMIATTPGLRSKMPLGRKANSGNTLTEKHYPNGVLYTGSANIPDDVASISVPYLLLDEVDRMPLTLEDEGDPIELALRRSTTFPRSKAFLVSTPTTLERSRIWRYWLASTQDRYHVPCPHCSHMQYLRWKHVQWLAGRPSTAVYVCEECAATIEERSKTDMLAAGEWRAERPEREHEVKGFHINGLYTPLGLGDTWAKHVAAFERAQGSPSRLQVFTNTRLGEVHKGERKRFDWETLAARRETFARLTVPRGHYVLTAGTDVQANRLETQVAAFGRDMQLAVVEYVVHYGDTTDLASDASPWKQLDAWREKFEAINVAGHRLRPKMHMIDAGYLPDTVLSYTREHRTQNVFATRGSTKRDRNAIGRPTHTDVKRRGQADKRGADRYELGVSAIKTWLFERLEHDEGTEDKPVLPDERWVHFASDLEDEYFKQLVAEVYDPIKGWVARANYHRNEALDTLVLCIAGAMHHRLALHRYKEHHWLELQHQLELASTTPAPVAREVVAQIAPPPAATAEPATPQSRRAADWAARMARFKP
jgi:phage terminase large subunit GpA-like protein